MLENFRRKPNDLERFIFMNALRERNETLYYRTLIDHLETMMPIVYTPTVGLACQTYSHIFRRAQGLWISAQDRGRIAGAVDNWPRDDVRIIVVTDGERILGLGDLGACGMGIPIGKLALYTACAGVPPGQCLPVMFDVGTDNVAFLNDPLYIGLRQPRLRGDAYDSLFAEFIEAVTTRFPRCVVQLEDFATRNAFRLLSGWRDRMAVFDDDIQGTAAITLTGLYSAMRLTGGRLREQRLLFLGAGEAGTGIAGLIVAALVGEGVPEAAARRCCWLFDTHGLVVEGRGHLARHKLDFAHPHERIDDFITAIETLRPTVIVGVSGQGGLFDRRVLETIAAINERPIVFALSNPTARAECTADQAYAWTGGRAIFASGSPFGPVCVDGHTRVPGQGNNVYIFPGVGFGAVACGARRITDEMFLAAARCVAERVTDDELAQGRIFPSLARIRDVSLDIAAAVVAVAQKRGLADEPVPGGIRATLAERVYDPRY